MIRIFNTRIFTRVPPGVTKGFIKGAALRLLRTDSSKLTFEENMKNFEKRLLNREYSASVVEKHLSEVKFSDRKASLKRKNRDASTRLLPFVRQYHTALPNLKTNEEMAPHTESIITKRNIYRSSDHIIPQTKIPGRHSG